MWFLTVRSVMSLSFLRTACYFCVLPYSQLSWLVVPKNNFIQVLRNSCQILLPPNTADVNRVTFEVLTALKNMKNSTVMHLSQNCIPVNLDNPAIAFTGTTFYRKQSLWNLGPETDVSKP